MGNGLVRPRRRWSEAVTWALVGLVALVGCSPKNVGDAERRGDVAWLARNGSAPALAALGRLADHDRDAVTTLEAKGATEIGSYIAAWDGVQRGAPWATPMLRAGLSDPARAERAASALPRGNPALIPWIADLETAVGRDAGTSGVAATVLASLGGPSAEAVTRRLNDPSSRGSMCRGLTSPEATPQARDVLLRAAGDTRQNTDCTNAIVRIGAEDPAVQEWIGKAGEPFILAAVSRNAGLPCAALAAIWQSALDARSSDAYAALIVPLSTAIKRCPDELDAKVAKGLPGAKERPFLVSAIDPFGGALARMALTCRELGIVAKTATSRATRERAADAFQNGCLRGN